MFSRSIWDEMNDIRRSFDHLLESVSRPQKVTGAGTEWTFSPAVETGWTDDSLKIRVMLPGVGQNDLQ